jgi:hypothetical protein
MRNMSVRRAPGCGSRIRRPDRCPLCRLREFGHAVEHQIGACLAIASSLPGLLKPHPYVLERTAGSFPVLPGLSDPGERIQSLTYRESYAPVPLPTVYDPPARLIEDAPALLRSAAGGTWALVSVAAAGSVLVVLVLVVVRIAGVLT